MEDMLEMDLKGVVGCPLCGKETFFVHSDAKGHASVNFMVDCESLKATLIPPKRSRNISQTK